jgi:hypothetical protein
MTAVRDFKGERWNIGFDLKSVPVSDAATPILTP